MKLKVNRRTIVLKKEEIPLSFVKGTPVLPALSKKNVDEIIELLEELDIEYKFYEEDDAGSEE